MSKEDITTKLYHSGRYIGPIFWVYYFEPTTSLKTSFRANKYGQLFFKLEFQEQDTISIRSHLNEYSSHNRNLDSKIHSVQWLGKFC